tara:strand:+ start:95 stop:325 length:231 start_codon:yes stop_codon:yes gene_type:complete
MKGTYMIKELITYNRGLKNFVEGKIIQYMGVPSEEENSEPLFNIINKYLDEAEIIQLRINTLERMADAAKKSNNSL